MMSAIGLVGMALVLGPAHVVPTAIFVALNGAVILSGAS